MSALTNFNFDDQLVRVIDVDGDPWFVLADICKVLGLKNISDTAEKLDDDEKGLHSIKTHIGLTDTSGWEREALIISEAGLYKIVMRSRSAVTQGTPAHRFTKWVTSEVLPQIRKSGRYQHEEAPYIEPVPPTSPQFWLEMIREARRTGGKVAAARIWAQSPLPKLEIVVDNSEARVASLAWLDQFIKDFYQLTGDARDRVSSGQILSDFRSWDGVKPQQMTDTAFLKAFKQYSEHYCDLETGARFSFLKNSLSGYVGIIRRSGDSN